MKKIKYTNSNFYNVIEDIKQVDGFPLEGSTIKMMIKINMKLYLLEVICTKNNILLEFEIPTTSLLCKRNLELVEF